MIKISVSDSKIQNQLSRFAKEIGKNAGPLIANEARLWCIDGMKSIPPVGIDKKAELQGKGAVARDVAKAFPNYVARSNSSEAMLRAYGASEMSGDISHFNRMAERLGNSSRAARFDPSVHRKSRSEAGRVRRINTRQYIVTQQDRAQREAHIKKKWAHVGMMKGALAWAAEKAGQASRMKGQRIPRWIEKQAEDGHRWLATQIAIRMAGAKTSVGIKTGTHNYALRGLHMAMQTRAKALARKARNLVNNKAAIIGGKYTILKSDRGDQ